MTGDLREPLVRVMRAALRAVEPAEAVRRQVSLVDGVLTIGESGYRLADVDRIIVVGAGKAGAPMTAALQAILGERISAGIVNVKHGHLDLPAEPVVRLGALGRAQATAPASAAHEATGRGRFGTVELVEAGHPTPDHAGMAGAARIAALLETVCARDLVLVALSGGGSALLPLPVAGVTLDDYRALTDLLLRSGADITEINTVRKHCSRLQGGQMARLAGRAHVAALILSDVVGSPLDVIASGPTVADPTTYAEALTVLRRYALDEQAPPAVLAHLWEGAAGRVAETPKPGDAAFERVRNVIIGDNASACRAAAAEARALGFDAVFATTYCQGEAREVGKVLAGLALGIAHGQSEWRKPICLVMGGETTVTVRGAGLGGRNQELALAAVLALDAASAPDNIVIASLATDGTDGPTMAAGGIALADSVARGHALGLDARAALAANDSLPYLDALGDLIVTGPTGTNVNDLLLVMVG